MSWTTITINDLNNAKAGALVSALRSAALGRGQPDPSTDIIATIIARIRAEISGCETNTLDQDTTKIPRSLLSIASRMVIREMQGRLLMELTATELKQQDLDESYLKRINSCEVPVEKPDDPIATESYQAPTGTPRITPKNRKFSSRRQSGS